MDIFGKTYYEVFIIGPEPREILNTEFLSEVANSYDPNFHKAPLWQGHPLDENGKLVGIEGKDEPDAYGWVGSLIAIADKLYASYDFISSTAKYLTDSKLFQYVSCEFVYYNINGKITPYLFAIGLTNRPACHGLEPLQFAEKISGQKFNTNFANQIHYTLNEKNIFSNQKTNNMAILNESLKNAATKLGIAITTDVTDEILSNSIIGKFSEVTGSVNQLSEKIKNLEAAKSSGGNSSPELIKLSEDIKNLKAEIDKSKSERNILLIETAISAGKITADQKDSMLKLTEANYDSAKDYISKLPVLATFAGKTVQTSGAANILDINKINLTEEKFIDPATKKRYTYEEVIKSNALLEKFTETELLALRNESKIFGR